MLKSPQRNDVGYPGAPTPASGTRAGVYRILAGLGWKGQPVYIGQSNDINRRIAEHWQALDQGKHQNKRLQSNWKMYKKHFQAEVIAYVPNEAMGFTRQLWLMMKETIEIDRAKRDSNQNCLNVVSAQVEWTSDTDKEWQEWQIEDPQLPWDTRKRWRYGLYYYGERHVPKELQGTWRVVR